MAEETVAPQQIRETQVEGAERKLSSTEIMLFFNASRTGKTQIFVEPTNDPNITNLFMITPAVMEAVKAERVSNVTFRKQPQAIPPQNEEQKALWDAGRRAFSWRPVGLTETELVTLEREAKLTTFRVQIGRNKKELEALA